MLAAITRIGSRLRTSLPSPSTALFALAVALLAPNFATAYVVQPNLWVTDGALQATHVSGSSLYIGGTFSYVGPSTGPAAPIDGTLGDLLSSFPTIEANVPDQPQVYAIIPDGAGGWYVGGYFHKVGGVSINHLAHITASNTLDVGFVPNPNQVVTALALSGSTLYVGGGFTVVGGSSRLRAAAVNASTGALLPWNPSPNGAVNTMLVSGSRLYVGGAFTTIDAQARNRIAAFNAGTGSIDLAWNPNANAAVAALASDGTSLFVGGAFTTIAATSRNWFAALDPTTGAALAWNPNPTIGAGSGATSLLVIGSTVYVAGTFSTIGGQPRNFVASVDNVVGTVSSWNPNPNGIVRSIAAIGSTVYLGGEFSTVSGQPRLRMAGVDATTGAPAAWTAHSTHGNIGSTIAVYALAVNGSTVYLGGTLSTIDGQLRTNLAALDLATGAATSWNPGANSTVNAFATLGSTLYVGGNFTNTGGQARGRLASFDLSSGNLNPWNPNASGVVSALAVGGSTVYVGGNFLTVAGQSRTGMAGIDGTTGSATAWNPNPSGGGTLALVVSGPTVYAAGNWTNAGGQPRNFIAALDATTGAATSWNPSANNGVNTILLSGSTLYAGGFFTNIGGQARNRIAALDVGTGSATSWNPNADGNVRALARSGTAVYAGGAFTSIGGSLRNFLASVDATTGLATTLSPSMFTTVNALALNSPAVYAGGAFPSVDGKQRHFVAGIVTTPTAMSLGSAPNPSTPGQLVTLTATLSPASATGTVTFFDGASVLGTAAAVGGVAMFSTSSLSTGTHTLSAGYSGDANHAPASAPPIIHEVKSPSSTVLASSPNPSWFGEPVTLTATVSPGSATGSVTFYDGASPLGTEPVSGGIATHLTSTLSTGTHSLSAVYSGDGNLLGSTSAVVSHTVNDLTITSSAGANGSITPDGTTNVTYAGSQSYTIAPDACYGIADVLVDGNSVGAVGSYTFTNVTIPHTISASFTALGPYTFVASAGTGGSIAPDGNVPVACGGSQSFTITPDACYVIADVLVDGNSVGAVSTYSFTNVTANHTIAASFTAVGPYTIAASAGTGGVIVPDGNVPVACGGSQSFTITPDACYVIADVLVDGNSVGAVSTYSFTNVTANHSIAASFTAVGPYTIAASAGTGGVIAPDGNVPVACGGSQSFTITPDACYVIADVLVDGNSVGAVSTYSFTNVTANHSIAASFTAVGPYTIAASAGTGGVIAPDGNVPVACGGSQSFTITPDACYVIADVLVDGNSVGAVSTYSFTNVTANHTIAASFTAVGPYTIAASAGTGGVIVPDGNVPVACGGSQSFTITPDACYVIADVLVDGNSVGAVSTYSFTNVTANHSIAASFTAVGPYTIAASAGTGGVIAPDGNVPVACGGSQSFTITPDACYVIADVLVDGNSVGAVSTYSFTNVTANHSIAASFTLLGPYTITASAGTGGTITPNGNVSVACGANQTFTITPSGGYAIADVLVDGNSVGPVGSYTFNNVTTGHTIAASFLPSGGTLTASITAPAAGSIYHVNTTVSFQGTFGGDGPGRTHTAQWMFDNLTVPGVVNESMGTVSLNYAFLTPGVYMVKLTVTNDLNASATSTQVGGNDAMVVIYDPSAGFITGGGKINSPAGALIPSPSLSGEAQFGFTSKHKKGDPVPTGETKFKLKFTSFDFNSTSYQWLVVTPPKAQCRGTGTLNGSGNYGFLLTVFDGDLIAGRPADALRIKIWNNANSQVVYDNQLGAPDSTTPTNPISNGSVVIHVEKKGKSTFVATSLPTGIGEGSAPAEFALLQNYPNPCMDGTHIAFALPENSEARLTMYDLQGRVVADLVDGMLAPGRYLVGWDGRNTRGAVVEPGVYFYRMIARSAVSDRKATLVRKFVLTK